MNTKLTPKFVRDVTKAGDYHDGGGLYLQVKKSGAKSWVFRYMRHGRPRKMGLGSVDDFGLAEARERARRCRQLLDDGIDPIDARHKKQKDERAAAAKQITLTEAHAKWLTIQQWNGSTPNRERWLWNMYGPQLGPCLLSELADGNLIVEVFTPICKDFKKSAGYCLQHLRSIINWAKDENLFTGDNPVNLKRTGKYQKSKFLRRLPDLDYEIAHRRPMPPQDVPAFVAQLRAARGQPANRTGRKGAGGRGMYSPNERPLPTEVMELQILTGGRPAQARLAQWEEFDLDNQTWKVPLHTTIDGKRYYRRKRSDAFQVYINRPAVELLKTIKKRQQEMEGGLRKFVFSHGPALTASEGYHQTAAWQRQENSRYGDSPFRYGGIVITDSAVREYFRNSMGVKNYDLHGFRGSFKQWQIEHGYSELAGEAVLDHQIGNNVRNIYAQGAQPYFEVIEMMDHWGQHCSGKKTGAVIRGRFRQRRRSHVA